MKGGSEERKGGGRGKIHVQNESTEVQTLGAVQRRYDSIT